MTGAIAPFRVELFAKSLPRAAFDGEDEALNRYFATQAGQDQKRRIATCYVAITTVSGAVVGYYTLAGHAVALKGLPVAVAQKLPRYERLPAALLGRLAVDKHHKGQGLGAALVMDAAQRVLASGMGCWALLVDPISDAADTFYRRLGFAPLHAAKRLFIPMDTLQQSLGKPAP